ncbi:MAG TPA: hypothetical protein VKU39_10685 [Streptosporangiaceae bacterium]|nr:hypothetical protein [Streptosporangiaceae bacterium]
MAGFLIIAVIAGIGIIMTVGWVVCVALGIRRDDRRHLAMTAAGQDSPPVSRLARHSTGLHWA